MPPKAQITKEKIGKLKFIKIKNFCASKNTIRKVKRQLIKWEKTFANHISGKGLIASIYIYPTIPPKINLKMGKVPA